MSEEGKQARAHGPLSTPRIPLGAQEPGFVARLQAQGTLLAVPEDWDEKNRAALPPQVQWVLFPNGDLLRIHSAAQ